MFALVTLGLCDSALGQTKSTFNPSNDDVSTTPKPFTEIGNPKNVPSISTGYYFMDNGNPGTVWDAWKPTDNALVPTTVEKNLWYRILSGPRQVPIADRNGTKEGKNYFRNPAESAYMFDKNDKQTPVDSVNGAIAGPIPLGFAFYFNSIRYDSFYVSTKGVIALVNRRYFYNNNGQRVIPAGMQDCYDPMSADWFVGGERSRLQGEASLNDATPDDYGYKYVVCGGDITNKQGGIRENVTNNLNAKIDGFLTVPGGAYIAPFYGPFYLPQYDTIRKVTDDYGQAWYKRSLSSDKLIIYYKNLTILPGQYEIPGQQRGFTIRELGRPRLADGSSDNDQMSGSCQVVLDRRDSSITFVYGEFYGKVKYGDQFGSSPYAVVRYEPAVYLSPYALVGIGGYARHTNYSSKESTEQTPWAGEYKQYTSQNYGNQAFNATNYGYISPNYSIKFKQWRNALRLVDVQYLTRSKQAGSGLEYTEEVKTTDVQDQYDPFELFAGEERLGSMQPVAIVQNLTNEIQGARGVNFVKQDFQFQARFRVRNIAYDRFIYNRVAKVSEYCLRLPDYTSDIRCSQDEYSSVRYVDVSVNQGEYTAVDKPMADNQNGIPAYEFARIKFPQFLPNEYIDLQVGLMEAQAITEAINPETGEVIGDNWPFDDSSKVKFWVIRRIKDFKDNVSDNNYHIINGTPYPSIEKWVHNDNEGPRVVASTNNSEYPMPPLGLAYAKNDEQLIAGLLSPFIQMNWNPNPSNNRVVGDKITSFPIDLRNKNGSILTLSVQRNYSNIDARRGFADAQLTGLESRVVFNGGYENGSITGAYKPGSTQPGAPSFDYLAIEFLKPSADGIKNITNTGSDNIKDSTTGNNNKYWRYNPQWNNGTIEKTVTNAPALAIYGGGGYFLGWSYADKKIYKPISWNDTIMYNNKVVAGIMYNPYDNGFDYEFYKYSVPIPDYYSDGAFDGGKNFRFRIRTIETNGASGDNLGDSDHPGDPSGDDIFFIDNVAIVSPNSNKTPDIEVEAVKIIWPYAVVPASQANDLSVLVRLSNVSVHDAIPFIIKTKIFKGTDTKSLPVYCRTIQQSSLKSGSSIELTFPQFNARGFADPGTTKFTLQTMVIYPGNDMDRTNDTTYSTFDLEFGSEIAYIKGGSNDVNAETGGTGRGLSLWGASFSGFNQQGPQTMATLRDKSGYRNYYFGNVPWTDYIAGGSLQRLLPGYPGPINGVLSGQIAVKFVLSASDTIRGAIAMFANANQAFDDIAFSVYPNTATDVPASNKIANSETLYARRLLAKNSLGEESITPAKAGEYVTYEFEKPLYLEKGTYWIAIAQLGETGIELAASGSRMAMKTTKISANNQGVLGGDGWQLMVDKKLRKPKVDKEYGNVYENNNIFAYQNIINEGAWQPFMPTRGHVAYAHLDHFGALPAGNKEYNTLTRGTWLPLLKPYFGLKTIEPDTAHYPCSDDVNPVELVSLNGTARSNGVELVWETASEVDNYGFYIERANSEENNWTELDFVRGAGNATTARTYKYMDTNVVNGSTYLYRLTQMDSDGTLSCHNDNIVKVTYDNERSIALEQNSPNPFNDKTRIKLYMPDAEMARVEVVDIFGKVVRVLADGELKGNLMFEWDGRDHAGTQVATGNYLLRLTAGDNVVSKKMSYIKNN